MKQLRPFAALVAAVLAFGGPSLVGRAQSAGAAAAGPFDSLHFRRSARHRCPAASPTSRSTGEPVDLLRRHRARRRLENHQQRHDVRGAVPGPGADVDRRRRVSQNNPDLVWVGTGESNNRQSTSLGRRRLQVDRRRQDLHQHGPQDVHAYINRIVIDPRNNDIVLVAATGSLFGPGRRARHLQDDRRRQDLEADAEGRRRHRRQRSGDGSRRTTGSCTPRRISGGAPRAA